MKKSVLSILLAICAVISLSVSFCAAQEIPTTDTETQLTTSTTNQGKLFSDVSSEDWYADAGNFYGDNRRNFLSRRNDEPRYAGDSLLADGK